MKNIWKEAESSLISRSDELSKKILVEHLKMENVKNYPCEKEVKALQDIKSNLQHLAEAVSMQSYALFENYLDWEVNLFESIGLSKRDIVINLQAVKKIIKKEFDNQKFEVIADMIDKGNFFLTERRIVNKKKISANSEFVHDKDVYLKLILQGDRRKSEKFISNLFESGMEIKDIYLHIFQNAQYDLGEMWQTNKISIAQEHIATGITDYVMSVFYKKIFRSRKNGLKMVSFCVSREMHELGLKMVTDIMELNGWSTVYAGANTPPESIIEILHSSGTDLLALSATMTFHIKEAEKIISMVRREKKLASIKIIAGGYAFNIDKKLYTKIGADLHASDCKDVVEVINKEFRL